MGSRPLFWNLTSFPPLNLGTIKNLIFLPCFGHEGYKSPVQTSFLRHSSPKKSPAALCLGGASPPTHPQNIPWVVFFGGFAPPPPPPQSPISTHFSQNPISTDWWFLNRTDCNFKVYSRGGPPPLPPLLPLDTSSCLPFPSLCSFNSHHPSFIFHDQAPKG
jgi:hypothetical protein